MRGEACRAVRAPGWAAARLARARFAWVAGKVLKASVRTTVRSVRADALAEHRLVGSLVDERRLPEPGPLRLEDEHGPAPVQPCTREPDARLGQHVLEGALARRVGLGGLDGVVARPVDRLRRGVVEEVDLQRAEHLVLSGAGADLESSAADERHDLPFGQGRRRRRPRLDRPLLDREVRDDLLHHDLLVGHRGRVGGDSSRRQRRHVNAAASARELVDPEAQEHEHGRDREHGCAAPGTLPLPPARLLDQRLGRWAGRARRVVAQEQHVRLPGRSIIVLL